LPVIRIVRVGETPLTEGELQELCRVVEKLFPGASCGVSRDILAVPRRAFNSSRIQFHSTVLLEEVLKYALEHNLERAVGITGVDMYTAGLNFVFGEAQCPGRAAVVSTFRLRPEFYGEPPNRPLFLERCVKEVVHELGHTFGLGHCSDRRCVMSFSNSIYDTDFKRPNFCDRCSTLLKSLLGQAVRGARPPYT